jgi:gliding motility-associated-like protein
MSKVLRLLLFYFSILTGYVSAQPANDDPCNATALPVNAACTFSSYTNVNATATTGVPAPGCANYQGGDVWFKVTVPPSGAITVDSKQGTLTDGGMAFYTGPNCNTLSLLACDNDNSNNGAMPLLNAASLVPGSTLWIRFWEYGNNGNGTFQLCATSGPDPTNQDCPNAIPICQNTYSTIISYSGTGSITNEINNSNSCLGSGEKNDVWYTFTVNTSGILNFLITPVNMGDDYDWAVYNLTNNNCSDIYNTPALDVSCNYSAAPGTTGPNGAGPTNNQNAAGPRYNKTIPVTAGQTYVINVSNFSSSADGYTIDFGASTANIFDNTPPALTSISQPLNCGASTLTFNFSENIQCTSVQNGDFTLTGPGGPYIVSNWTSNGCATGADYDNTYTVTVSPTLTTTGNYSFCLTNASGSVIDLCGNVAPPTCFPFSITGMTANINATDADCNGASTGSATVVPNGGTLPYSYTWSPNVGNTATVNNIPAGSYTVTVADQFGCSVISNINVNEPTAIVLNMNANGTACLGNTGSIVINANGGTPGYQYSINNGATFQNGNTFNNLSGGNYDVVVKDANGCQVAQTVNITTSTPPVINATPSVDVSCNGGSDGSINVNANGGTGAIQYSIDNGATFQASNIFNGLPAGNYTVVIQDANNCTATVNVNIAEPPALVVITNPTESTCGNSNGSIDINANGGTGALQYSIDGGATFQNGNIFNGLPAGNYNIVVQDANGCQTLDNIVVNDQPAPVISATPITDVSCNGGSDGSIVINSNGGTGAIQYSIDNGNTFQNGNTFNGLPAGNYDLVIQDANGCTAMVNVNIAEPSPLVLISNATNSTCGNNNGSIDINANGGTGVIQYSIDNGATFQPGNTFNNLPAGNYDLVIQDANGCTASGTINVPDEPAPVITGTPVQDVTCNGGADGSIVINTNGGTGAIQYSIDNGNTFQNGDTFNGLLAGNYQVVIQDANGCTANIIVNIAEPSPIVFNTNIISSTCGNSNGSIHIINANGGTGAFQCSIDGGASFQNGTNFNGLAAGNYDVVVQDANGCQAMAVVVVNNAQSPVINTVPVADVSCNGGSDGSIIINANGGTGAIQYSIDNGATFQVGNIFNGLPAGTYTIIIEDANGCQANTVVDITEPTPVVFNSNTVTATCGNNNGHIHINANGGTGAFQYSIDNGATFQNGSNFNNLPPGNYNIVVQDANGCTANGVAVVNSAPSPVITSTPATNVSCNAGSNGTIIINSNGGAGTINYSIDNGANYQAGNSFNNLPAGNYNIIIQDANGCTAIAVVNIAEPSAIVIVTATTNASCGNSDGTIIVNANGGTGAFQYSIDGGTTFQNGNVFSNLLPMNYNVVVTDANNCQAASVAVVNNSAAPAINNTPVNDVTCNGGNDGSILINANGGTGILQYSIDNGITFQLGNQFNGLPAGAYNIIVQDINGCQDVLIVNVTEPTAVAFNANQSTATCGNNNGSINIAANGGTGAFQYSIDNGTTFQPSATFNNLAPGNYDIIVQDANGCIASGNITVNSAPSPTIALVNTINLSCNNSNDGSISIIANGGTGAIQYSIDNGVTFQSSNSFNNLPAGNYTVVIQDANGCIASAIINLAQPSPIVFNPVVISSTCGNSNGSININANGGNGPYQYSIDNGVTFQAGNIFNGLIAGNYDVVIKDATGCTASGIIAVMNAAAPSISGTPVADASCYGLSDGSITINGAGGVGVLQYSINGGITYQNGSIFNSLPAGNYSIVVQDANGCTVAAATTINEPLQITFNTATINSNCGSADGSINITAQGGSGVLQYSINNGVTFQVGNVFNNLAASNYNVIVQDASGCQVAGIVSINNLNGPVISSTAVTDLTCFGSNNGAIVITANGGTGTLQYSINNGLNYQSGNSFSNLPGGAYSIIVLDGNNCVASSNIIIDEPSQVNFNTVATAATCGNNNGTIHVIGNGGTGNLQYSNNNGTSFQNGTWFNTLAPGNYSIVVHDANGCSASAVSVVIDEASPTFSSITPTGVSCNNGTNGAIIIVSNGGTGAIQYSIDNGITFFASGVFNNLPAGNYNILIRDINSCTADTVINISQPAPVAFNVNAIGSTCSNSNGSIIINANGGTGAYQYSINNGATFQSSNTFNGVAAGNYIVLVKDVNGCNISGAALVNDAPSPVITSNPFTNVSCNGNTNGTITILSNGGAGTILYSINNGSTFQTLNSFDSLAAGTYHIVIQDTNGCSATAIITITQPPVLQINLNTLTASCGNDDGTLLANANGGTGAYQYSIDGGATFQVANSFNNLYAGNYSVIVKDANGCTAASTAAVNNTLAPVISSIPVTDVSCNGGGNGTITVNGSGGTGTLEYSADNGLTFQFTNLFNGLPAGTYNIIVQDALGCQSSLTADISQPDEIIFTTASTLTTCGNNNGTISIAGSGGTGQLQYSIDNGTTFSNSPNFNSLAPGNYPIVVHDANSCQVSGSENVSSAPLPVISSVNITDVSCNGFSDGAISVNAAGGVLNYSINNGISYQPSNTFSNLVSGNYSLLVKDTNGCTVAANAVVAQPSVISLNTNFTNVNCSGGNDGTIAVTVAGGTPPYSYLWSTGATTSSIAGLVTGVYKVTVTDNHTCIAQKTTVVSEPQPLVLSVTGAATICLGQSATIAVSATGGTAPYIFTWSNGFIGNSQTVSPGVTSVYTVNIVDANNCTAVQQAVTVTVNPPLSVLASDDDAICNGQTTVISASASGGNGGPYTYLWSNNATASSATVSPVQTTTYTVTVADNCGTPSASDAVTVIVNPLPDVGFIPLPVSGCVPLEVSFIDNTTTAAGSEYHWDFGDSYSDSVMNPVHTYTEVGSYNVNLTVTTPQGCRSSLLQPRAVTVYPLPIASFISDPQKASILHPEFSFKDQSSGVDYWHWDFGDASGISSEQNPLYRYKDTGSYHVTLITENIYTCADTAYGEVIIFGDFTVYIPNAFSPDGDGRNDFFNVYGIGIQKIDLFIFNRWGEQVFYTNNVNKSWNGYSQKNNKLCPEDVYVYLISVVDLNGKKHDLRGNVTLVR